MPLISIMINILIFPLGNRKIKINSRLFAISSFEIWRRETMRLISNKDNNHQSIQSYLSKSIDLSIMLFSKRGWSICVKDPKGGINHIGIANLNPTLNSDSLMYKVWHFYVRFFFQFLYFTILFVKPTKKMVLQRAQGGLARL